MQNIFNRTNITLALAGAFALVSLAAAVACDTSSGSGAATATPVKQPATQVIEVQPTPNATQVANLPAATPKPAAAAPHVVWMAETHAGAGAITVDIETDVPTSATISLFTGHAGAEVQFPGPESDQVLKTHHTISIGTGGIPAVVHAVVTDVQGKQGIGNLSSTSAADGMFWRLGTLGPRLATTGQSAEVTWNTLRALSAPNVTPGSAILLSKQAGCTTAQACLPTFVKSVPNTSVVPNKDDVADSHSLALVFPDATHDYYVVLVGPSPDGITEFYQFDVTGASLKAS